MHGTTSSALWSTVAALPDYLLLAQTRQLARHEQALQILVLDHLREIEARQLHLTRGYGSLFDYVVRELGYTAAAAWRRIKAMRLSTQIGVAGELLRDGSLKLSNAAQLQNLFERSDRNERNGGRLSGGDGVKGGPGGAPRDGGASGDQASSAPVDAGERGSAVGPVLDAAAREKLVKQAAGKSTREVQQMLAEVDPELAQPNDRLRALGSGRWELKAAVDAECRHGLEKLQMLLSHTDPHLTLGGLVARLVRDGLDRYDPERPRRGRGPGGRASVNGERPANTPARRGTEAAQRSVVRTKGGAVGPRSEVEPDGAAPAVVLNGVSRPSAPKQHTGAEHGGTRSAPVWETTCPTASAAKRHTEAERGSAKSAPVRETARPAASAPEHPLEGEHGSASPAAVLSSGGPTASAAKRRTEFGRASRAEARDGCGRAVSAVKRHTETAHGGTKSAAARGVVRRTDSAPKRVGHGADALVEDAERVGGAGASAQGRGRETTHASRPRKAMRGSGGRAASLAKGQGRAAGDGWGEGKRGVPGRATCAVEPHREAGERSASLAPARGRRRFATSAAKRLAYGATYGAVGLTQRSPALERHLAALHCCDALPGCRSRYIPAGVRREVWRRDRGCCSYVDQHDQHGGRRCGSRYRLEIDHIVPFALGGATELFNLRLRCGAHHRLRHAQAPRAPRECAD